MYEKIDACPICKHASFTNEQIVKDHAISAESFVLVSCDNCRFLFTNPRPSIAQTSRYYASENYISHQSSSKTLFDLAYSTVRFFTLRQKAHWIKDLKPQKGKLLDLGCGVGSFLHVAKSKGWEVHGVEPNKDARSIAQNKGLQVEENLQMLSKEKFDIISLWHVLEHIPNLSKTLTDLRDLLRSSGYLIIAIPNYKSFDAKHYQTYWAGYDVPRHLYHFEQATITLLAKNHKFNLHKILPLKLDAFYVSLLSEKYKKGSMVKAISNGFRSNTWANKNGNNYSSLVYIFKK